MARHPAHHGHEQPEPSKHHAKTHDAQMAAIDRHHAQRNRGSGHHVSEGSTASVAGSSTVRDLGNKARTPKGKDEMGALKRAASGRPDNVGNTGRV